MSGPILVPTTLGAAKVTKLNGDAAQMSIYQGAFGEEGVYHPAADIFLDSYSTRRLYDVLKGVYGKPTAEGLVEVAAEVVIGMGIQNGNPLYFHPVAHLTQMVGKRVRIYIEEVK